MTRLETMEGGCLCGAVRYRVRGAPFDADHCHCRMCQRHTGAVVGSWMDFRVEQVEWLEGEPAEYASSEHFRRGFCAICGSTLSARDTRFPQYYSFAITSLDDPNRVSPNYHIFTESQLEWLVLVDDCPRYPGARSAGAGD